VNGADIEAAAARTASAFRLALAAADAGCHVNLSSLPGGRAGSADVYARDANSHELAVLLRAEIVPGSIPRDRVVVSAGGTSTRVRRASAGGLCVREFFSAGWLPGDWSPEEVES
jgi:hypothetical protein